MAEINYTKDPWGGDSYYIKKESLEDYIKWNIICQAFMKYNAEELEQRLDEENVVISSAQLEMLERLAVDPD
jgi:hypothetical protein